MSTKKLKILKIMTSLLNVGMGIISIVYEGMSMYYIIHKDLKTSVLFMTLSIVNTIVFIISCNLHDAIVVELEDRKYKQMYKHNKINSIRKISKNIM